MGAFDSVDLHLNGDIGDGKVAGAALAVVEAGCKTDDVIRKTMESGLTVPLGSRPSVGAGLWLQGGIGHLSRLHGLACDAIVGAVLVSLTTGEVLVIGCLPFQQQLAGPRRPNNDDKLLWALKGAGTNSGVVISVTFTTYPAPIFQVRNWLLSLRDKLQALEKTRKFDEKVASRLPQARSADAYLYWGDGQLQLGVAMIEVSSDNDFATEGAKKFSESLTSLLGPESSCQVVDSVGMFETEMYLSGMHGGHGGGKTSSFKRCLFIKDIGTAQVLQNLSAAIENRPSLLCYLHLLRGGGAVGDVAEDGTAFGCRDWDFACVITGVWPRCEDDTQASRACVSWVYKVAEGLLPLCSGVYSADLGPDPRDALLATKAFGPNRPRLSRIKEQMDPRSVLAYTCPLPKVPKGKLVVLVTGKTCAGKDYCAQVWASVFNEHAAKGETAEVVSISEEIKREYAAATGADRQSLLHDRAYKEQHRRELTAFFQARVRRRPRLPEQHFLDVVFEASDADVLFITGMRDEAPVVTLSHLVPDCRLVEVRVNATNTTRSGRGGVPNDTSESNNSVDHCNLKNRPTHVFCNDHYGDQAARKFARECLLPYVHRDLTRLADLVSHAADFPRPGVESRHVLDISQKPGGLPLCASLLQSHFAGAWAEIDRIVCCEAGGFLFASALALKTNLPLALIREAGKLPTPTVSAMKQPSHISSFGLNEPQAKRMEIGLDVITPNGSVVVVVVDVLATGETLCAVLELLRETGVNPEQVSVMVVAEFPIHRGRALLREIGFGEVTIQSLLVFGGR
ncbi:Adenine phosphoribosyltransferase [Colletotrichum spinosum]|uniref:Adenine phosphoribosyltransferase n=1 Tax=Colletotrichum spinosum TaxID=1347390 RepID=A0A4R8QMB6_9PEZI|nr:Adenine phosphoribosyltransferase [Colletotrichum spinosum]